MHYLREVDLLLEGRADVVQRQPAPKGRAEETARAERCADGPRARLPRREEGAALEAFRRVPAARISEFAPRSSSPLST